MEGVVQDLRYGMRGLLRSPGFTAVAVITLALGIGANTVIFSAVSNLVLRPLPFKEPDRIAFLWATDPQRGRDRAEVSYPDFVDWRSQNRTFEDLAAFSPTTFNLTGLGEPMRVSAMRVSASLFSLWGIEPILGRTFRAEEDRPGARHVVMVSHGFWARHSGSRPDAIGQTLMLDGEPHTVVGVLPPGLEFGNLREIEMGVPLALDVSQSDRERRFLRVTGRLRPGITLKQAAAELRMIAERLQREFPDTNAGWGVNVVPLSRELGGPRARLVLALLGLVVLFVLLIACTNVANLLLARATGRQREVATRTALGASRLRLIRQLLTESVLLALLGGAFGLLLAIWGVDVLIVATRGMNPAINEMVIDRRVLSFTLAITLAMPLIFGLWPAVQLSRTELNEALKEGGSRSRGSGRGHRTRRSLVVSQLALALMLLLAAGLIIRTVTALQQIEEGFDPENILTARLDLPALKYRDESQVSAFFQRLVEDIQQLPGVRSASAVSTLPVADRERVVSFIVEGRPVPSPNERPWAAFVVVSPGYLETMRIPLLRGRSLSPRDSTGAPAVALISRTMARRYWPDEDPIGKRIRLRNGDRHSPIEIVGVVGDIRNSDIDAPPLPLMYVPHAQHPQRAMVLVVRTESDPLAMAAAVKREIWRLDKEQPVYEIRSMQQVIYDSLSDTYVVAGLFAAFALVALLLAASGIYGVISFSVNSRIHEIGIRLALGAQARDVLAMVMRQGWRLVLVGLLIGLAGGFALARVMTSLLYGITATDPLTWLSASLILAGVALLACYLPARRAMRVDPIGVLRYE